MIPTLAYLAGVLAAVIATLVLACLAGMAAFKRDDADYRACGTKDGRHNP